MKRYSCLFLFLACLVASCDKPLAPSQDQKVELSFTESTLYLNEGEERSLSLVATSDGKKISFDIDDVVFDCSDEGIAIVTKGVVHALKAGTTTIKARYKDATAVCSLVVEKKISYRDYPEMPLLTFGTGEEEVRSYEKTRGNEPYLSGAVADSPGETYITVLARNSQQTMLYDYFFDQGKLVEAQWYTKLYEQMWSLEDGGKPTEKAMNLIESWGFKFYGYDNSLGAPTCVSWNAQDRVMCTFGPRFRSQQTLFMFNFFESEEPIVSEEESSQQILLTTELPIGSTMNLQFVSDSITKIVTDPSKQEAIEIPAGSYNYNNPITVPVHSATICIKGGNISEFTAMGVALSHIQLQGMEHLRELRLLSNNITTIELDECPRLEILNVARNQLATLDVTKNARLRELHCFKNTLAVLQLPESAPLELLYAYHNKLSEINLHHLPQLKYLHLSNNLLKSIDIHGQTNLIELQCASNQLAGIDLPAVLSHLMSVNLAKNKLTSQFLDKLIEALPNVKSVDVAPDETNWKKVCNLTDNSGYHEAQLDLAREKGWLVK